MKSKIGAILAVIVIIIAVIGSTYSWFMWRSQEENNIGINFTTTGSSAECITYKTTSVGSPNLIPVSAKEKGYLTNIEIAQTCNTDMIVDLDLTLTTLPTELINSTFKYTLVNDGNVIENNFSTKHQGDTFTLISNQPITATKKTYKLYLWIDGNSSNPSTMQNKQYRFDLVARVTDEVE